MSWRTGKSMKPLRYPALVVAGNRVSKIGATSPHRKLPGSATSGYECRRPGWDEHAGERVGKADTNLPVKVRSGQSRADRPGASLAGVAATRGLKRRQRVSGVCGLNPEIDLSWGPSWNCRQRRQHGRHRYARGRSPCRGLRARHAYLADTGTQEVRQVRWLVASGSIREGKTVAWCCIPVGSLTDP